MKGFVILFLEAFSLINPHPSHKKYNNGRSSDLNFFKSITSYNDTVNVTDYGITGDGRTGVAALINKVISNTPSVNTILYFPPGKYLIDTKYGVLLSHSNISLVGSSHGRTIFMPGANNIWRLIEASSTVRCVDNITIKNICFECINGVDSANGALSVGSLSNVIIDSCEFRKPAGLYIVASKVRNLKILNCDFRGGDDILIGTGDNIIIENNRLWNFDKGLYFYSQKATNHVFIKNNIIDGMWYLKEGGLKMPARDVSCGPRYLCDPKIHFHRLIPHFSLKDIFHYRLLRVLYPVCHGRAVQSGRIFTDKKGDFVTRGVIKGDLVETESLRGIIDSVVSNNKLRIAYWYSANEAKKMHPPENHFQYKVLRVYLGRIMKYENDTLYLNRWYDLNGVFNVPPPDFSTYEIIKNLPSYGLFLNDGVANSVIEGNIVMRNYCDQIADYGSDNTIKRNTIYDGQDEGITIGPRADKHDSVINNYIAREGTSGIFVSGSNSFIADNYIKGPFYTTYELTHLFAGITIQNGMDNIIKGNKIQIENPSMKAIDTTELGISLRDSVSINGNNRILHNIVTVQ